MKKTIGFIVGLFVLVSCESELTNSIDVDQKPAQIKIKGYSSPDAIQIRFNGEPVAINNQNSYIENIETDLLFVLDKGESNLLGIYNNETGNELAKYKITYDNSDDYKDINFFNLPGIFLNTYAVKPTVNLGKVGFVFLFPNLGEFSNSQLDNLKGVLKRENGAILATFDKIGKENFSDLKIYNFFSASAPVFLELYKPGTTEPYAGSDPIRVKIIQNIGANMIVLQETIENGNLVIKGDVDIADYL